MSGGHTRASPAAFAPQQKASKQTNLSREQSIKLGPILGSLIAAEKKGHKGKGQVCPGTTILEKGQLFKGNPYLRL